MKIKLPKKGDSNHESNEVRTGKTTLSKEEGVVVINHHQTVRQSQNYQSAEAGYAVTITVKDTPKAIRKGIARAEELVEKPLSAKILEQKDLLNTI